MNLIVIAGIKRSGSTWLFNAVRLMCEKKGSVYYDGAYREGVDVDYYIMKKHPFKLQLAQRADVILTSDRDRDEIRASLCRFYGVKGMKMNGMIRALKEWNQHSSYCMQYEEMIKDKRKVLMDIKRALRFDNRVDINQIELELEDIQPPIDKDYDPKTFLFKNHITK